MPASRSVVSVLLRSCEEPPLLTRKRPHADEGLARTCRDAQHSWLNATAGLMLPCAAPGSVTAAGLHPPRCRP
jgi:hypothetical protein